MTEASIGKLAAALAKAQSEMKGAKKDSTNPHFKKTYADLASIWDACREPLSKNELSVAQPTALVEGRIVVKTILLHSSGESIEGILPVMLPESATSQQLGSAITYNRRYGLAAMIGVAPEDDDGAEASTGTGKTIAPKKELSLADRMNAFSAHLDKLQSEAAVTNAVAVNNSLLFELKQKLPQDYEKISGKINQIQDAFRLAEANP
jgi:hypothetical protein